MRLCFNELQPIDPHSNTYTNTISVNVQFKIVWEREKEQICLMLKWIIEIKITATEEQNQNILYMKLKGKKITKIYTHIKLGYMIKWMNKKKR